MGVMGNEKTEPDFPVLEEYADLSHAKEVYCRVLAQAEVRAALAVQKLLADTCPRTSLPNPPRAFVLLVTKPEQGFQHWVLWPADPFLDPSAYRLRDKNGLAERYQNVGVYTLRDGYHLIRDWPKTQEERAQRIQGAWLYFLSSKEEFAYSRTYRDIISYTGYRPSQVLSLVRGYQRIEKWCLARAEGRRRQALHILGGQHEALQEIEKEYAFQRLISP